MIAPAADRDASFAAGMRLGKYELLATIGKGGFASVILARHRGPAGFEKVVVVKVVHPHMAQDEAAVTMLLDEARLAAQIDHPNVVHTYELGEAHGTFYIVMEYLAGESFHQVIRRSIIDRSRPLRPHLAARIVADACDGLHAAHELVDLQGQRLEIVHRDVSPGNIVVLYSGGVKVVDFGIAKAHGRVTSSQEGELKGKFGYMAPEQINNEPMDRRSDLFSLGVVLWESLAKQRLFQTDSVGATLMKILAGKRTPPSQLDPTVPPALDEIALKALAPDPRDRFQTAAEMKAALDDVLWQTRCSNTDVHTYMTALFDDRIAQRRTLLARAAKREPIDQVLEALAVEDARAKAAPISVSVPTANERPSNLVTIEQTQRPRNRSRIPIIALGLGATIAGISAAYVGYGDKDPLASAPAIVQSESTSREPPIVEPIDPPADPPADPPMDPPADRPADPPVVAAAPVPERPDPPVIDPMASPEPAATRPSRSSRPRKPPRGAELPEKTVEKTPEKVPEKTVEKVPEKAIDKAPPEPDPAKPRNAAALVQQATEHFLGGRFPAAQSLYEQALAIEPNNAAAHRGVGFVYQRMGWNARALQSLRTYLTLRPNASDAPAIKKRIADLEGK